jgi:hypothetical protein
VYAGDDDDDDDGTIRNVMCQESGFYPHPPGLPFCRSIYLSS